MTPEWEKMQEGEKYLFTPPRVYVCLPSTRSKIALQRYSVRALIGSTDDKPVKGSCVGNVWFQIIISHLFYCRQQNRARSRNASREIDLRPNALARLCTDRETAIYAIAVDHILRSSYRPKKVLCLPQRSNKVIFIDLH